MQCFNIGNQGFYSIFGRNRNILRLKYKVILPCSAQLSTRTLLNFPEVLTLHPNLHSSKSPRLVSVIFDSTMQKWHTTHQYNVSSIRLRRHFHIAHDRQIVPPPPPFSPTQKKALGLWDLARGRELVRGKMYLKRCDKSGKLQIKVLSVMWPGKWSLPAMLQSDAWCLH